MNKKKDTCSTGKLCLSKGKAKEYAKLKGWKAYKCKLCGRWHVEPRS